eukprot:TRINITY_DN3013_c0_g1_i4.p1 TRINITY_DN3013_c0_g1~~TRINITY_DN3013_c0_g1_i4.p1  ORF type:complete len:169 (-),score=30.31 TRINITY_DN3013_c0_g1_i4:89-595(-)
MCIRDRIKSLLRADNINMYAVASNFMPAKFILCIFQFILLVFLTITYKTYAFSSLQPEFHGQENDDYKSRRTSIIVALVFYYVTLTLEFATSFMSIGVYFGFVLGFQVMLHAFGCICTALMLEREWDGRYLWGIWAAFSLFPLLLDIICFLILNSRKERVKEESKRSN